MSESPRQSPRGPGETIPAACYISGTSLTSGLGPPGDVSGTVHEGCCDQCPRPGGTQDNGTALCFGPGAQKSETGVSAGLADGAGRRPSRPRLLSLQDTSPSASSHLNRVFNAPDTATRGGRSWGRGPQRANLEEGLGPVCDVCPPGPHRRPRRHPREPGPRGKAAPREACWVPGSELDVLWLSQDCTAQRALRLGTEGGDTPGIGGDLRLLLAVGRGSQKSKGPLSAPAPAHRAAGTAPLPACRAAAWKGACKPADRSGAKPRVSPASAATAPPVQSSPERRPS